MAGHGYGPQDHAPLQGVVLCCTSILPEERANMADVARQMGAQHMLDLTSDVTHLIVGNIDTPKYKYTAKEREDIKVLRASWLEAVRVSWMEGEEVDVARLEEEHRLPTLLDLRICVTGFEDPVKRQEIQQAVASNGAQYYPDLSKVATHLIAAKPTGAKYDFAARYGIKTVSIEWLQDSLARGMALDETLYHPTMPVERRGEGAVFRRKATSASLGKRIREGAQGTENVEAGRRKLRRVASTRLESQNDDLWENMGCTNDEDADEREPEVAQRPSSEVPDAVEPRQVRNVRRSTSLSSFRSTIAGREVLPDEAAVAKSNLIFNPEGATDSGIRIHAYGFDERKTTVLQSFLVTQGAIMVSEMEMRARISADETSPVSIVIPHTLSEQELEDLQARSYVIEEDKCLTEFWVEKCLHRKMLVDQAIPLCTPFRTMPIKGFERLTICPTSFSGIDLLHFSKAVKLMGASYDECLRKDTSVLVCDDAVLNQEKLRYAMEHSVPVVSTHWLWACILNGYLLSFTDFALSGSRQSQSSTQPCFYHPVHNPQPRLKELKPRKAAGSTAERERSQRLELRREPVSKTVVSTDGADSTDSENDFASRQKKVKPLEELPQQPNSPRKSQNRLQAQVPNAEDLENSGYHEIGQDMEMPPTAKPITMPTNPPQVVTAPLSPSQNTANLNTAIAHLLAHQQKAASFPTAQPSTISTVPTLLHRYRPLGRAPSNPSSLGASVLSRNSSVEVTIAEDLESMSERIVETCSFQPSQKLSYEDPESLAVRQKLVRKVTGTGERIEEDDGGTGMERVARIGGVVNVEVLKVEGARRGRRRRGEIV